MTEYKGPTVPCASCGQAIWWAINPKTGKRMPMNRHPHPGLFEIEVDDGEGAPTVVAHKGKVYTSHFATCPQAEQWRGGNRGRP